MSEKIGGAKGTELDDDFVEMERKVDVFGMMVTDLMNKTHEFLQPNPASRAKLMAFNSFSKIRGQAKSSVYPQPEGTLGETMIKYGKDLGEDRFGACLGEAGEAFKDLADIKYALEDNVKQNFLDPLNQLANKDLKEVNHHRKKLSGRRLDYDCKRRKKEKAAGDQGFGDQAQGSPLKSPSRMRAVSPGLSPGSGIADDELKTAEEKFEETKAITETAMFNLLDNDVEQITQLQAFVEAITNYHKQSASILERLCETLDYKREDAVSRPKSDHVVKRVTSFRRSASPSPFNDDDGFGDATSSSSGGGYNFPSTASLGESVTKPKPCCKAMYDFEPENEGELGFSEGDIIDLIQKVDDNWFEGSIRGQTGYFPVNYVEVIVDVD
ncbi:endophilin-A3-like isoform X1 [Octopus vulgaris]|uniref:Endophilin-A3-like isoform X1 n=1 Tax=Octopus vulgaris TaxID=6645 RepID=A0AA36BG16_OCTVU|nr:endophilin-A3-like isoform X1 [Octopus vulgaris]